MKPIILLCQLEMYFPPSFFDIMVHLIVHLVREIRICGPVFLRWMYPIERCMKIFKGYVKNPYRPEASIVERYIAEETIGFCTMYMSEVDAFIMAYQAKQVFYVKDPSNERWSIVIQGRTEYDFENNDDSIVQHADNSLSRHISPINEENDVDEVHATRTDHNEGIWENIVTLPK